MMPLLINIITNWAGGKGLTRDGCLLEALFTTWGYQTTRVQYTAARSASQADLNLFLETLRPEAFPVAPRNVWVSNPEWARQEDLALLPRVDAVWCKTQEAYRLFAPLTGVARYLGFESEDRYDALVPRVRDVLHVAGNNILKGTSAVLAAWEQSHATLPPLIVVGDAIPPRAIPGVTFLRDLPDAELRHLQNRCQMHLCPSETEGWGHAIHEGLGVGAMVLTTGAPPMEEFGAAVPLPASANGTRCLSALYRVEPTAIAQAVQQAMRLSEAERREIWWRTRARWHRERAAFRLRLQEVLG